MKTSQTRNTIKAAAIAALTVLTLACGYSSKMMPAGAGSVPAITQLNPAAATAGEAAFTLTLTGTNFGTKAVVNWNGVAQTTTDVSATQLTIMVPASDVAASGSATITVTNPGTSGGIYGGGTLPETSAPMSFAIN